MELVDLPRKILKINRNLFQEKYLDRLSSEDKVPLNSFTQDSSGDWVCLNVQTLQIGAKEAKALLDNKLATVHAQ